MTKKKQEIEAALALLGQHHYIILNAKDVQEDLFTHNKTRMTLEDCEYYWRRAYKNANLSSVFMDAMAMLREGDESGSADEGVARPGCVV